MDNLMFFIVGFLFAVCLTKKPVKIQVHHKHETLIPDIPEEKMPKMHEVMEQHDAQEDNAYEEMGKILENVNEIFGGSDRV